MMLLQAKEMECSGMFTEKGKLVADADVLKKTLEEKEKEAEKAKTELANLKQSIETQKQGADSLRVNIENQEGLKNKITELQGVLDEKEKVVEEMRREMSKVDDHLKQVIAQRFFPSHLIQISSTNEVLI